MTTNVYKALVFDEESVNIFSSSITSEAWFSEYNIPDCSRDKINRVEIDGIVYLLSKRANTDSKCLVIRFDELELFDGLDGKEKSTVFDRILVVALSRFGQAVSPGKNWGKYVNGERLSIYATKKDAVHDKRVFFHTNPCGLNSVYAYSLTEDTLSLLTDDIDEDLFLESIVNLEKAINVSWENKGDSTEKVMDYGIELNESLTNQFDNFYTVEQWYENKLTDEQRTFVDKAYDEPVRLKGGAGTGKTLALAVKFLRDAYQFESREENRRLLFVTHSHSTAQHVLDSIRLMDEKGLYGGFKHVNLKVVSLYDLAQDMLNYDFKKLTPLSTDGKEGRELQHEIISSVLERKLKDLKFVKSDLPKCTERFQKLFLVGANRRTLTIEILNEFACILDAENIFLGSNQVDKYLSGQREPWQMELETENERRVILDLHNDYVSELKDMGVMSMDQMVADLNGYLGSHEWNHLIETEGFDALFIDELHCFTRPERMVFHSLYRKNRSSDSNGKVPLFMAYDTKQATDDRFLYSMKVDAGSSLFSSTRVGKTELVELTKVFRYTPEIANFLGALDGSFPALDLPSEWNKLVLNSQNDSGSSPTITLYATNKELVDNVFREANRIANRDKKKTVAVLCIGRELFDQYLGLGRIRKLHVPIVSREDVLRTTRLKGKCIFSMPEYVAGLQFDTVFLIHLDKNEVDEDNPNSGVYRRFVSQVYLGASRAKTTLKLSSSSERRGVSRILNGALASESLIQA